MKKLLKIEVCGSYEQCTRARFTGEKSTTAAKKKKSGNANANVNPNTHLLIKSFASVTVKINKFISFFLVCVML